MEGLISAMGPMPGKSEATLLAGLWSRSRSFLVHIVLVVLVCLFMHLYVNGRSFYLAHNLSLRQANESITHVRVMEPVQSDITTIISLLASTARGAATFWLAGIDLRCIFLFMERGGVTFEGLQTTFRRSLPSRHHFRWKTNFIILAALHAGIFASTYTSSILAGSVTWKAASLYKPGQPIPKVPFGQLGDPVLFTSSTTLLDSFVARSTAIYSIFYGEAKNRYTVYMNRILPDSVRYLPLGSRFEELTVPYFAVDSFEWIKDPTSTIPSSVLTSITNVNTTGPRIMTLRRWGLIPDDNEWGPSDLTFPEPQSVSESRILVMSGRPTPSQICGDLGVLGSTIPSDVHAYTATFKNVSSCFIFANVTYQAGAARSRRCQMSGPGVLQDVGNVKDLHLVEDPATRVALDIAPYVSTTLFDVGYAIPFDYKFPNMEKASIELLSRSYQVAWNALTWKYGLGEEQSNVSIAVEASTASVSMWRVAVWATLHGILVALGFAFRLLHSRGHHPWIEDPVTAALLVDPTTLMNDPRTWAGDEPPHIGGMLKLEQNGTNTYLVLEEPKEKEKKKRMSDSDPEEQV